MDLFQAGLATIAGGGVLALLVAAARRERLAVLVATAALIAGAAVAAWPAGRVLAGAPPLEARAAWSVPGGEWALGVDRLSAFFVVTVLGLAAAAGVYGAGYLEHYRGKKALGPPLLFFNLLPVALCVVCAARNAVLFLVAWEVMTLLAFLLVGFEDEKEEVRSAGLTYLVVSHVATLLVVLFFLVLGREAGSLDFATMAAAAARRPLPAGLGAALFALAVLGFGTKAGIWPLHIWLPEAHPAAPSHVSAVLSGVLVKTAIYALVRALTLLGPPPAWWGVALIVIGAASGVLGVLYALAQHDLKRLLAYHTIENIGIIVLGIGVGFLGVAHRAPAVALLGFAGGILHVLNHAAFKGLLFMGAGSVLQATGTREIDRQGGLARAMPWTAATFGLAAAAISGLPPLNGFVSEWLVYAGSFRAGLDLSTGAALAAFAGVGSLAAIGGLAAACFAKATGIVFLGEPRSEAARGAHECRPSMRAAMVFLAVVCVAIGLAPQTAARVVLPVAGDLAGVSTEDGLHAWPAAGPLEAIARAAWLVLAVAAALALLRRALLRGRDVGAGATWGCGFGAPNARMQYSASSFADPLIRLAGAALRPEVHERRPEGYYPVPGEARRATHTADLADEAVYRRLVRAVARAVTAMRWLQSGRLQLYLLYILVTVVVLLVWQVFT